MARTQVLRKVYVQKDGTEGRSAKPGWTHLRFELLAPAKVEDKAVVLDSLTIAKADIPATMQDCMIGHGLSQKLGDDLSGIEAKAAKEEPPVSADKDRGFVDYAKQRLTDAWDNIKAEVWVEEGEGGNGGTNITILLEAMKAAFADQGSPLSDEQVAEKLNKLKDADYRKKAASVPAVDAHVKRIRAERAAEAAKAARAKAKEAKDGTQEALAGL